MDSDLQVAAPAQPPWRDLALGGFGLALLLGASGILLELTPVPLVTAGVLYAGLSFALIAGISASGSHFGPADRVTLARAVLVLFLTSLTTQPELLRFTPWAIALLCLTALVMDGADGYVARRTGTASSFGARFDMEVDAFFILVLCIAIMLLGKTGTWVLLIGLMRYGFVIAGRVWPWLEAPLPESFRRKTVCVWQTVTLMVALLPVTGDSFAQASLLLALGLLAWSFTIDVRYLYKHNTENKHNIQRSLT